MSRATDRTDGRESGAATRRSGSVAVLEADQTKIVATVQGDSGSVWQVSWTRSTGWRCKICPGADVRPCRVPAHVLAVQGCTGRDLAQVGTVAASRPSLSRSLLDCKAVQAELGVTRAVAEKVMRQLPVVLFPSIRKTYVKRPDLAAYLEQYTFQKDEVPA